MKGKGLGLRKSVSFVTSAGAIGWERLNSYSQTREGEPPSLLVFSHESQSKAAGPGPGGAAIRSTRASGNGAPFGCPEQVPARTLGV